MHKEVAKYLRLKRKHVVLEYARVFGSNLEAYKACGIPKSTFYDWKKAFEEEGEKGLTCLYGSECEYIILGTAFAL